MRPRSSKWREHRGARADDDAHVAGGDGAVGEQPLARRQPRVQHGHLFAREALAHAGDGLTGQPDLGDEEQHGATALQRRLGGLQVHLGLAAARDPVHQDLVAGVRLAEDGVQGVALLGQQVGDVAERRAGLEPSRLGDDGRRDRRLRAAARCIHPAPGIGCARDACPAGPVGRLDQRAGLEQLTQCRQGEAGGGAQRALVDESDAFDGLERGALPRTQPAGRDGAPAQGAAHPHRAGHVHAIRDAHPALAPIALGELGQRPSRQLEAGALRETRLPGLQRRLPARRQLVLTHDLERPGRRAHQ